MSWAMAGVCLTSPPDPSDPERCPSAPETSDIPTGTGGSAKTATFQGIGGGPPIDGPHSTPDGTKVNQVAMDCRGCPDVPAAAGLGNQALTTRFCPYHMQVAVLRGHDDAIARVRHSGDNPSWVAKAQRCCPVATSRA